MTEHWNKTIPESNTLTLWEVLDYKVNEDPITAVTERIAVRETEKTWLTAEGYRMFKNQMGTNYHLSELDAWRNVTERIRAKISDANQTITYWKSMNTKVNDNARYMKLCEEVGDTCKTF